MGDGAITEVVLEGRVAFFRESPSFSSRQSHAHAPQWRQETDGAPVPLARPELRWGAVPEPGGSRKVPSAWGLDLGVGGKAPHGLFLQKQEIFLRVLPLKQPKVP